MSLPIIDPGLCHVRGFNPIRSNDFILNDPFMKTKNKRRKAKNNMSSLWIRNNSLSLKVKSFYRCVGEALVLILIQSVFVFFFILLISNIVRFLSEWSWLTWRIRTRMKIGMYSVISHFKSTERESFRSILENTFFHGFFFLFFTSEILFRCQVL